MSTGEKLAAVMSGSLEMVRQLGAPIEVVGDIARAAICAPPGHRLLVGDFSGIESRVLAWIADQHDKVAQWLAFDRSQDRNDHPYVSIARSMGFSGESAYDAGKRADLAFGYQGGLPAYKNFAPEDDPATDAQIEAHKQAWRARHPNIVQFWWGVDRAAIAAVNRAPQPIDYGRLTLRCERRGDATFLYLQLPSGRRLAYPFPKLITSRFNRPAVEFMDNAVAAGGWTKCNHEQGAYGGLWTENIVSGIARDLLAAAMVRLEAAGYPVVLHVHDEVVCELPDGEGSLEEFKYLIERLPDWAVGLPVAAKVRNGPRFAEVDAPVEHVPGAAELPPLKPRQTRKAAAIPMAFEPPTDVAPLALTLADARLDSGNPIALFVAWAIEREAIRLRKEAGQEPPFTTDPILAAKPFCNTYRKFDAGTRYVAANIVEPHRDDLDLWFAIAVARLVNEPTSLAEVLPFLLPFDAAQMRATLEAREARGEKIWRGAYRSAMARAGEKRIPHLIENILKPLWANRETLRWRSDDTLVTFTHRLRQCDGIGPFIAAQIAADLKSVEPARSARDYLHFALPGDGSKRGLNRARGRPVGAPWSEADWYRELITLQIETTPLFAAAGLEPLDAQDTQHVCCEVDKFLRAREAGGKLTPRYKSAQPEAKPRQRAAKAAIVEKETVENETVENETVETAVDEIPADLIAAIDQDDAVAPELNKVSAPPGGNGTGKEQWRHSSHNGGGSKSEAEHDTDAEDHGGEPFSDGSLLLRGYHFVRAFDYTLPHGTLLYEQRRYELRADIPAIKGRPHKRFLPRRQVNGAWVFGAGPRHVLFNWPAIVRAGPGANVFVAEGEANATALIKAGLLATTVLSHKWTPECVVALTGYHSIILADHDKDGEKLAADAQRKLAPVAASTRIVPAPHLWQRLPGQPEPKLGDDVEDWIALGGDPKLLLDICREIPADGMITAEPYQFRTEADIAPWQWLYGRHLLRGEVAGTAAMGGTGKSTSSIVEALAMASGRALLGKDVSAPLRVVLINLEDTRNTMDKRIAAAMRVHNLTAAALGDRLIVIAKGEIKIKVAKQLRSGDVERNEPVIHALINLMHEHRADVLSIDSFIRTHRVHENDNSAIEEVVECFETVATATQCAVHLWHHTRKAGGEQVTVESARGAQAFIDACRSVRILETMTAKEHEELLAIQPGLLPAGFYFRAFNGKRNFAPPADQSDWSRLESVVLANGDDVGVVTAWAYPQAWAGAKPEALNAILDTIDTGMADGRRYSKANSAKARAVWPVVQEHCPDKTGPQCRGIIKQWCAVRVLYEDDYDDPASRKTEKGLFVDASKRPHY